MSGGNPINARIVTLRENSLQAPAAISTERARLITEFYQSTDSRGHSIPVQRAMAFAYLLRHKAICIQPMELIVGERGPAPKATPTYPEICLHSLADLEQFDTRKKVPFRVSEEDKRIYQDEIIPYWKGRSTRDIIFSQMTPAWLKAYETGVFTEFQEQRTPGHTALGNNLYNKGMSDIKRDIETALAKLDFYSDPEAFNKQEELRAMMITAEAMIHYAERHAELLDQLANAESEGARKVELLEMARICRRVPKQAPATFYEALQAYWFIHVGIISELNPWDAISPGRFDQHLFPFYDEDIKAGILTPDRAKELLSALWVKFNNHPSPPKMGVTGKESNTYVDFVSINLGGLKPDGTSGVNELSYLMLDVIEEMRQLQPNSNIQLSQKTPDRFLNRALKVIKTGLGQPALFNADGVVQILLRQGKAITDAREGGCSGCIETGAFGREAYFLTGYLNLTKILELTLHNGVDPISGEQTGCQSGEVSGFTSFAEFMDAFTRQLQYFCDIKIKANNVIERIHAQVMPVPFLSLFVDDCIANGKDYNDGGARYNTTYIQGVGLGTTTDSLAAIQYHVYDKQTISMSNLLAALSANFSGYEHLREQLLRRTPKYGNDDDYADAILQAIYNRFYAAVNDRPNTRNGVHRIMMLPTTAHVYFGSMVQATPDGRLSGMPLSEGISPVQGADVNGPTAVIKSASKIDQAVSGGTLLNQRFLPQFLAEDSSLDKVALLVRTYFKMDGHHIQFNVVSSEQLKDAKAHPDQHRELIVRVAGYSDYFVDLTEALQNEIIERTAHAIPHNSRAI